MIVARQVLKSPVQLYQRSENIGMVQGCVVARHAKEPLLQDRWRILCHDLGCSRDLLHTLKQDKPAEGLCLFSFRRW